MEAILETRLPLPRRSGKVRDVYDLGSSLLIAATDRISAFDVVLPNAIPCKGATLNQLSTYWFREMARVVENHVLESDFRKFPENLRKYPELEGRSVIVKKAQPFPVEAVVRGYLSGSAWKDYRAGLPVSGIALQQGLVESQKLPEPIFTPSTKATSGHDEAISAADMAGIVGKDVADIVVEKSIAIYGKAAKKAEKRGIIIADTKFEFGLLDGRVILIDELLTPDSSRFWPADAYEAGRPQKSFDKQYVRDYLESIKWNKQPPAPTLPQDVVDETSRKYQEAYERITGKKLAIS
jgi:phosphoribosylaminoimidazole-succinocarboxamide synthase